MFILYTLSEKVLDGNHEAASLMADTVHKDIPINTIVELEKVKDEVDTGSIGIWIDPIGDYHNILTLETNYIKCQIYAETVHVFLIEILALVDLPWMYTLFLPVNNED